MANPIVFANDAQTTLAGSITNVATTANLAPGSGALFPNPGVGQYFVATLIDTATGLLKEVIHVTQVVTDTITMVRAQEGTTALSWNAGDIVAHFMTAGTANAFRQAGVPIDLSSSDVANILALAHLAASNTVGGIASMRLNAGNPNGSVAGNANVNGASDFVYDTTNKLLYICTTTGTSGTAVWSATTTPAPTLFAGGTVERLQIVNNATTPNTKIDIGVGPACLVNVSGQPVWAGGYTATVDLTVNGVNGMDTGARPTNGWVYLYAISDGTNFRFLASQSATSPTMPGGYTYRKYLGAMRCDGSQNLMRTLQNGRKAQYVVTVATNTAALPTLLGGGQGNISTPTYVAASVSALVPPTAGEIKVVGMVNANNVVIVAPNANYGGYTTTTNPPPIINNNAEAAGSNTTPDTMVLESTNVYAATSAGCAVFVAGWTDYYV